MTYPIFFAALIALAACSQTPIREPSRAEAEAFAQAPASKPAPPPPQPAAAPPLAKAIAPAQTPPGPVPPEFRHVWAIEIADCKREPARTRIAIAPGSVRFYEGRSEVVSLEQSGPHDVIMQVSHVAEGSSENQLHTLQLNDAGTTLTYSRGGSTFTYTRCD